LIESVPDEWKDYYCSDGLIGPFRFVAESLWT